MMMFIDFMESKRSQQKAMKEQAAWQEAMLAYLAKFPVQVEVKKLGTIVVSVDGHTLELTTYGGPVIDGKPIGYGDYKYGMDRLAQVTNRPELKNEMPPPGSGEKPYTFSDYIKRRNL